MNMKIPASPAILHATDEAERSLLSTGGPGHGGCCVLFLHRGTRHAERPHPTSIVPGSELRAGLEDKYFSIFL